jgi:hypothetical protein
MIDPLVLSYLAGTIDADGHITVSRSVRTNGKRYTHSPTYYHPRIGFTSTDTVVPDLLKETFGGSLCTHTPKNKNHKKVIIWAVGTSDSGRIATALLPYLRLKLKQAELVIELCHLIDAQHAEQKLSQKPPYRITCEQLSERERLWVEVTKLNQPRNRRVHYADEAAGRLLDGREHFEIPA